MRAGLRFGIVLVAFCLLPSTAWAQASIAGLPGMTGWDAIVELKSDKRTRNIPVLMLTGHVLKESQERAAEAGADGFIPKPCLPDELSREIKRALKTHVDRGTESNEAQQDRTHSAAAETRARLRKARARKDRS